MDIQSNTVIGKIISMYNIKQFNFKSNINFQQKENQMPQVFVITHNYGFLDILLIFYLIEIQNMLQDCKKILVINYTLDNKLIDCLQPFKDYLRGSLGLTVKNINIYNHQQSIINNIINHLNQDYTVLIWYSFIQNKKGIYYIYQNLINQSIINSNIYLVSINIKNFDNLNPKGWESNIFDWINYYSKSYGKIPKIIIDKLKINFENNPENFIKDMKKQLFLLKNK